MTVPTQPPTSPAPLRGRDDLDAIAAPNVPLPGRGSDPQRSIAEEAGSVAALSREAADAGHAPGEAHPERWTLRLYVAGQTERSLRAVANMEKICSTQLQGRYRLEVIDLRQQPQLAQGEQIVAVPTLIRRLPEPLRMLIGDMSDCDRVLIGLDLLPKESPGARDEHL